MLEALFGYFKIQCTNRLLQNVRLSMYLTTQVVCYSQAIPELSGFHDVNLQNALNCRTSSSVDCQHCISQRRQLTAVLADRHRADL